jgi:hypothetical protein
MVQDLGARSARDGHSRIRTARVDNDHLIDPIDDGRDAASNSIRLVFCYDETGYGEFAYPSRANGQILDVVFDDWMIRHENATPRNQRRFDNVRMMWITR